MVDDQRSVEYLYTRLQGLLHSERLIPDETGYRREQIVLLRRQLESLARRRTHADRKPARTQADGHMGRS